jgi:hypothetical protein
MKARANHVTCLRLLLVYSLVILSAPARGIQEAETCGNDSACLRRILSNIEQEVQQLDDRSNEAEDKLRTKTNQLALLGEELRATREQLSTTAQKLQQLQTANEKSGSGCNNDSAAKSEVLRFAPLQAQTSDHTKKKGSLRVKNVSPTGIGNITVNDVIIGIYRIEPQASSIEAPYFGQSQFRLTFSPHVLPGDKRVSTDLEFFVKASLPNPDEKQFSFQLDPSDGGGIIKVFPIESDASVSWKISRPKLLSFGTFPTELQVQLGRKPANSSGPIEWEKSILLIPEVSIKAPDPIRWSKENLELLTTTLGVVGTGGFLGIWGAIRRSRRENNKKETSDDTDREDSEDEQNSRDTE